MSRPNVFGKAVLSIKVFIKVSLNSLNVRLIFLQVLFSDWLLVEPLILLFTMTFMNTVTK